MEETSDHGEKEEGDVPREEKLVGPLADWQQRGREDDNHGQCRDDAPVPIGGSTFSGMRAVHVIDLEVDSRVEAGLNHSYESDPAMKKEECTLRPVREPEEDIVAARVKKQQGNVGKAQRTNTIADVCHDLPRL